MDGKVSGDSINKIVNASIVVISALLLLYTGYRAATLSFTIDESISFNVFVPLRFMEIISYKIASTNHHMLNTLAMKVMSVLFGSSEFSLRFPSLACHLFYIIFTYKFVKRNVSPHLLLAGFLLLNLNPYLLDFFSLARGYAMAITFTVISLYFLFEYVGNQKEKYFTFSLGFAMLAILSNFSLLIYYVSLILVVNLYWISLGNAFHFKEIFRKNFSVIISSLLLILILFEPIRKLIKYKEFYDGGLNGFWSDTVNSLVSATLYEKPYQGTVFIYLMYFVGLISILLLLSLIYKLLHLKLKALAEKSVIAILILFVPCMVTIIQHYILNSNYLINRMALFFIPIFFINIFFFADQYADKTKFKLISSIPIYSITVIVLLHTVNSLNGTNALYWKFDADTKKMLSDLDSEVKRDTLSKVKLGVMTLYEPAINFYRITRNYDWLEKVTQDGYREGKYNYYYLGDSSSNFISGKNLTVLKHYATSASVLVVTKN
jgi:hypothetical protein